MITTYRVAVILNPTSFDDPAPMCAAISQRAQRSGFGDPLWLETTEDDAGDGVAEAAIAAGVELLLVCGGDGTVAAVAGRLAQRSQDGFDATPSLAVLAVGTGNLLARNLGLPVLDPSKPAGLDAALDVAFGPGRRRLDVLDSGARRFLVMAGLGFDATMIRDTDEELKDKLGWAAYLGGLLRAVRRTPRARFELQLDDGPPIVRYAVGVLVGNVGKLQGGVELLPDARPDDGKLAVLILSPRTAVDWLVLLGRVIRGCPDGGRQAHTLHGRQIRIRADRPLPVEYDGDFDGLAAGLCVDVLPGAVQLCTATGDPGAD